jgi:YbbR domain-containing protein
MIAFLRNLFLEDIWLKLFSLALAVLTWLTVTVAIQKEVSPTEALIRNKELTFSNLPVVVLSAAGDVHAFRVDPKEVQLTVQGDPRILASLKPRDIRVMVDLTGIDPVGDVRKPIKVSTPAGVTHVRVVPQDVLVIFPPKL